MDNGVSQTNHFKFLSYNTTGWSDFKSDFINTILITHTIFICAIQEHFLLKNNLYRLRNAFSNYNVFSVPAVKNDNIIHSGRPSGGLAFICHRNLSKYIECISCPNSHRTQGLKLKIGNVSHLFINSYFPVDKRNYLNDELTKVLQDIKYLINTARADNIILMGDLNTDLIRNTVFTDSVKTFLQENNLQSVWETFNCDFTYCHTRKVNGIDRSYFSTIDHFCLKSNFVDFCIEASPIHMAENLSNHEPIFLNFKVENQNFENVGPELKNVVARPLWKIADQDDIHKFKIDLHSNLSSIRLDNDVLTCNNAHCTNPAHLDYINTFSEALMSAISISVESSIPFSDPNFTKRKCEPGWNHFVKPFCDTAKFWYSIWLSAGKPQNCVLHTIMKKTRNKFHFVLRKVRKIQNQKRKETFLSNIIENKVNNIFTEIRKMRKVVDSRAPVVDGATGEKNISQTFKNIYEGVYNVNRDDKAECFDYLDEINRDIGEYECMSTNLITLEIVKKVILNLNKGKGDVNYTWGSEALIHGVNELSPYLQLVFKIMLVHGHMPSLFSVCALTPLVKNKNASKSNSDNYRLIAISSLILKILDNVILALFGENFKSPFLQFGFQKNLSTTLCTWTMMETINFFTNRGSPMYVCLLDLTKAFDHVKHKILFEKLKSKIPSIF